MRSFALLAVAASALALAAPAQAGDLHLSMLFQSGATFDGTVSFTADYSAVTSVTGTLHGYGYGVGFDGVSDDSISWLWLGGANFSDGAGNYSTFLMDGTDESNYTNWIQLAYNYDAAPVLVFTTGASVSGTDNYIDYADPMVSGSLSAAPEPASWALMLGGFGLVGGAMRRRQRAAVTFA